MLYRGVSNACFSMLFRIDIPREFCILWGAYYGGFIMGYFMAAFIISLNVHTYDDIICCIAGFLMLVLVCYSALIYPASFAYYGGFIVVCISGLPSVVCHQ